MYASAYDLNDKLTTNGQELKQNTLSKKLFRIVYKIGYATPYLVEELYGSQSGYDPSRVTAVFNYSFDQFISPGCSEGYDAEKKKFLEPDMILLDFSKNDPKIKFFDVKDDKGEVKRHIHYSQVYFELRSSPFSEIVHSYLGEEFIKGEKSIFFVCVGLGVLLIVAIVSIVLALRRGFKNENGEAEDMEDNSMFEQWMKKEGGNEGLNDQEE